LRRIADEHPVLHGQWLIEAELAGQPLDVCRCGLISNQQRNGVPRGPSQDENDHRDDQQCQYGFEGSDQ
jgi:hypothetical protein